MKWYRAPWKGYWFVGAPGGTLHSLGEFRRLESRETPPVGDRLRPYANFGARVLLRVTRLKSAL